MRPRVQVPTLSTKFSDLNWPTKGLVVEVARHRSNLILALLCAAQFMLILDIAIVNVALPSMQRTLGLSAENIQWVVGGYALTFGGFLMLGGRLADVVGRRRMFLVGLIVFIGASGLGGFSQSGGMRCRPWIAAPAQLRAPLERPRVRTDDEWGRRWILLRGSAGESGAPRPLSASP